MYLLSRVKLHTKILFPVCLLAVVAITGLLYVVSQYKASDEAYSSFIDRESAAAVLNARATANLIMLGYATTRMAHNDPETADYQEAASAYERHIRQIEQRLRQTVDLVTSRRAAVEETLAKIAEIDAMTREIMRPETPGFRTSDLSLAIDRAITAVMPNFTQGNDEMTARMTNGRDALSASSRSTIVTSLVVLGCAIAASIFGTLYVTSVGITRPIADLRNRMTTLAAGRLDGPVAGADRADEIGEMARAVLVFQENAIRSGLLEQQAGEQRRQAEEQRLAIAQLEKSRAEAMAQATESLAAGLRHLSSGNLEIQIEECFSDDFETLRADFNLAVRQLRDTLNVVASTSNSIDGGAKEV
ncbi:MAG TPA: methyl-accepting chemotaxis protein, partial [Pyrinomonadaceae bacterium]|nr:methyl-accepting chemotaxis protein [Pyrinomonadaceae bacterium]